jgi:ABC-2 type transport system permease protein
MLERLVPVLIMTAITLASIVLAVYVTGTQQVKGHIVIVSQTGTTSVSSKYLSVVTMKKEPPYSALVRQQYDAYVIDKGNGNIDIKTLKNAQFKGLLLQLIKNPKVPIPTQKTDRGVGVNIIGFLMMFLLMGGFMHLFTFAEDKEQGQLVRIATSPVSFAVYIAAHCIYCLSMFLPTYLLIVVMKLIGLNIGFSLLQYALLFVILSVLGISFALLLNTFIKKPDNANMLGNSIVMLTSVLAGSFFSFNKGNSMLDNMIKILPQKEFIDFAQHMQNGDALTHLAPLFYVIVFSAVLFLVAYVKLTSQYVKKI